MDGRDKPLIGVNIGALGFMTSVAEDELARAVRCLAADDYRISNRTMIESSIQRNGRSVADYWALNEVLVKAVSSRIVTVDVSIDDEVVTSYRCDGLMISTPTGSTGHSLSAGGPIIMPGTQVFAISVICPHTLSNRPLVVSDRSRILLQTAISKDPLLVSIDGQIGQDLRHGDSVLVRRSDRNVRFIHLPGHSDFAVLRQKLNWSGSAL
jgi:NAD+ kinase